MQSVPELYPSFSMPLEPDLRKEERETRRLHLVLNKKNNSKPGFNSSCKSRGTRGLLLPWKPSFLLPFSVRPDLCPGWEFRAFKPKQTPLFSRPQIPGLEMCFQISTTPAGLVVKEAWKLGLNTKRELAFRFLPKPSDLTPFFLFPLYFFPSPRISGLTYEALNI